MMVLQLVSDSFLFWWLFIHAYFVEMFFELWSWIRDDFYLFFIIRPRHCLIMICDNCFDIAILLFFS